MPLVVPLIRVSPLPDSALLDAAIAKLGSYRWLVFASANGVEFFMRRLEALRPPPQRSVLPRVAAVGPGTAAALDQRGIGVDFVPPQHTAAALAAGLVGRDGEGLAGAAVLMPRALEGREEAAALLRRHGARVDDIAAYRTEALTLSERDLPLLDGLDAILFASGSAVHAWCDQADGDGRLTGAAGHAVIACIGPTTAAAARDRGLRVDVEALSPTADGLVEALDRHFAPVRGRAS